MFKDVAIRINIGIVIMILFCSLLSGCNSESEGMYDMNEIGNSNTNLLNGGSVAKEGEILYYRRPHNSSWFNALMKKEDTEDKTSKINHFLSIPQELCVSGNTIFFKKYTSFSLNSALYRIDGNGGIVKKIISNNVSNYSIYNNAVYYIPCSGDENVPSSHGLFTCDFDGDDQKNIISREVSEFVFRDNSIIYTSQHSIRQYNIETQKDEELVWLDDFSLCHLALGSENLFFVGYTSLEPDATKECIFKLSLKNSSISKIHEGPCAFLHVITDEKIFFRGKYGYRALDTLSGSSQSILNGYNVTEFYSFGTDVYFYSSTADGNECLYQTDIEFESIKTIA